MSTHSTNVLKKIGSTHKLRSKIIEAADDYLLGWELQGFADENGGLDKLREDLFNLIKAYNYPEA